MTNLHILLDCVACLSLFVRILEALFSASLSVILNATVLQDLRNRTNPGALANVLWKWSMHTSGKKKVCIRHNLQLQCKDFNVHVRF